VSVTVPANAVVAAQDWAADSTFVKVADVEFGNRVRVEGVLVTSLGWSTEINVVVQDWDLEMIGTVLHTDMLLLENEWMTPLEMPKVGVTRPVSLSDGVQGTDEMTSSVGQVPSLEFVAVADAATDDVKDEGRPVGTGSGVVVDWPPAGKVLTVELDQGYGVKIDSIMLPSLIEERTVVGASIDVDVALPVVMTATVELTARLEGMVEDKPGLIVEASCSDDDACTSLDVSVAVDQRGEPGSWIPVAKVNVEFDIWYVALVVLVDSHPIGGADATADETIATVENSEVVISVTLNDGFPVGITVFWPLLGPVVSRAGTVVALCALVGEISVVDLITDLVSVEYSVWTMVVVALSQLVVLERRAVDDVSVCSAVGDAEDSEDWLVAETRAVLELLLVDSEKEISEAGTKLVSCPAKRVVFEDTGIAVRAVEFNTGVVKNLVTVVADAFRTGIGRDRDGMPSDCSKVVMVVMEMEAIRVVTAAADELESGGRGTVAVNSVAGNIEVDVGPERMVVTSVQATDPDGMKDAAVG
jgi:hypothetical protein